MHPATSHPPALIAICGATATGKSGLALAIAERLATAILSADSRQVYCEFDIGTAKPSVADRQRAPHYLIDICHPADTLTVADYQQQAQVAVACCHQSGTPKPPLLVGGTGLYIKAVVRGMKIPRVPPQPALRAQLASLGQSQCYAMLQQVDPDAGGKIHPNDSVRTLRALEVFYATGRPISQQQGEIPPDYPILQIGLDCSPGVLDKRIARRTSEMLDVGWLDEVEYLCQKYGSSMPLLDTLGYREMRQYLAGDISLDEAKKLTVLRTRQFAKRQRTWFRAYPEIEWFDAEMPDLLERVWERVREFLESRCCILEKQ
ncbi:MAG: tRNA (adenosine(37)-N6)-dimethylallyltransferase MiaA [Oscillatoria sp. Prado101]|jgi:tRNA dimethylallyltransferase|nr:tRNA (adenosine(37)-N6)-dimethylallyltransferase MiaA [Oscillatoria sp. Prado101]